MNKKYLFPLGASLLALSACNTTIYGPGTYDSGVFNQDYYIGDVFEIEEGNLLKEATVSNAGGTSNFFNGGMTSDVTTPFTASGLRSMYPALYTYTDSEGNIRSYAADDSDGSYLFNRDKTSSFALDNALAYVHDGFRNGVLSKLYNGQAHCLTWYANARVQCDKNGFNTKFPTIMDEGDMFYFALRGNTNDTSAYDAPRYATMNLVIKLFVEGGDYYQLTLEAARIGINSGLASQSTMIGTSLAAAFGEKLDNIIGYGVQFETYNGSYFAESVSETERGEYDARYNFDMSNEDTSKLYFGFSVYEVSFMDASWR